MNEVEKVVKKVMEDNPDLTTDAELKEAISQEIMRKYRVKNLRDFGVYTVEQEQLLQNKKHHTRR